MSEWRPYPFQRPAHFDTERLRSAWARLHLGDGEPEPNAPELWSGWCQFHNGDFKRARDTGMALGPDGWSLANKATCVYASLLEPSERNRLNLFQGAADLAAQHQTRQPERAGGWYWHAFALGRYSQGLSVTQSLAQGLGRQVRQSLQQCLRCQPLHPDAHLALASYHAEVIDKMGELVGNLTHQVDRLQGLALFEQALKLNPNSPAVLIESANGLVMLQGQSQMAAANGLYLQASRCHPLDATDALHVRVAQAALEEA